MDALESSLEFLICLALVGGVLDRRTGGLDVLPGPFDGVARGQRTHESSKHRKCQQFVQHDFLLLEQSTHVDEMPGNGRSGGHRGTHEMRAAASALAAFEI